MNFLRASHITPPPQIIPRPDHCLSRGNIDVEVLKVLYRLYHQGYQAYLVGGSVRDLLLGKKPKDFDVVTNARPGEIRRLFRNSRIIGRRFRLVQVFFRGGKLVEVSTFRSLSEFDDAEDMLTANNTFGTPDEDAQRRDLTINSLFYNIADFSLIDYLGGLEDLRRGIVRVIGAPEVRFRRDPVRMIRVLRHAARTGFVIDPEAWQEIKAGRELIRCCVSSRVRDELLKDFKSGASQQFWQLMIASGLFTAILPAWEKFLGPPVSPNLVEQRILATSARLDLLVQSNYPLTEAFYWACLLIPYLENFPDRYDTRDYRQEIQQKVAEALSGLEFAGGRRDDICMLLATVEALAYHLNRGSRVPAKLKRRSCFAQAWLLYKLNSTPPENLLQEIQPLDGEISFPSLPPARKKRRHYRKHPSKKSGPPTAL
jgi:poly(A) polymerase